MGIANADAIGVQISETDPSTIAGIAQGAQIMGYFNWQNAYENVPAQIKQLWSQPRSGMINSSALCAMMATQWEHALKFIAIHLRDTRRKLTSYKFSYIPGLLTILTR